MAETAALEKIREARESGVETLRLSAMKLTSLPPEIGQLTQLTTLDLEGNQLTSLPAEIGQLTQLTVLNLHSNHLTSLPAEIGQLTQLTLLTLEGNQLTLLPPELTALDHLRDLGLHRNRALGIPDEILGPTALEVHKGDSLTPPKQILDYYFRSIQEEKRPLLEAKVLIVGQGAVGKTSLVNRLVHGSFDPDEGKTEGIDIVRWKVPGHSKDEIRVNIWDFGGQEIMHATHQFFLTRRSLYLLVLDARKRENESNLHRWLRIIQSFGGDSPVLVITNKNEPPNDLGLNENRLRKDFAPNIKGFFKISCKTGKGLEELKTAITKEIRTLDHVYDTVPISFLNSKAEIEGATAKNDYLETEDYAALCSKHGITSESDQALLLRFLHDLGSVLHFSDEERPEFRLDEKHILNPEWVTKGVYKILNDDELEQAHGVLKANEVSRILSPKAGYPKDRQFFIIGMMRKFELCFDFPGGKQHLVAELLSPNEPELGLEAEEALRFEYHYEVLPEGVLPRFIVRNHHHLGEEPIYWRSGVLLKFDENRVLVREDLQADKIFVSVFDDPEGRRRALAAIRLEFISIHRSLPGMKVDERVPLPEEPEVTASYDYLLRLEKKGVEMHLFEGASNECSVRTLLDGVTEPVVRQVSLIQPGLEELALRIQTEGVTPEALERLQNSQGYDRALALDIARALASGSPVQIVFGDNISFRDQATMQQQNQTANVDLGQLATELSQLKEAMREQASSGEHFKALTAVAEAEAAAKEGKGAKAIKMLKGLGQWGGKLAGDIAGSVLKEMIKGQVGG